MEVRLNDDLLELITDAGDTWRTITDTLQYLHVTVTDTLHAPPPPTPTL